MLRECQKHTGHSIELPLNTPSILTFINWLATIRKVKAGTIHCYLAGVRQLHVTWGLEAPQRSVFVKLVLEGISNKEGIDKRSDNKRRRLPITVNIMKLIRHLLKVSTYSTKASFGPAAQWHLPAHSGYTNYYVRKKAPMTQHLHC